MILPGKDRISGNTAGAISSGGVFEATDNKLRKESKTAKILASGNEPAKKVTGEKTLRKSKKIVAGVITVIVVAVAVTAFCFRDGIAQRLGLVSRYKALAEANVGDSVLFGAIDQDDNADNGKEPIEWRVLEKDGDRLFLITEYVIARHPFNEEIGVNWETSSCRRWMNEELYNGIFSDEEQKKVLKTNVKAEVNWGFASPAGNDTEDYLYLLSYSESKKFFPTSEERRCTATATAIADGVLEAKVFQTPKGGSTCWWWLRTTGRTSNHAVIVLDDGDVRQAGHYVTHEDAGVRPVMWVEVKE